MTLSSFYKFFHVKRTRKITTFKINFHNSKPQQKLHHFLNKYIDILSMRMQQHKVACRGCEQFNGWSTWTNDLGDFLVFSYSIWLKHMNGFWVIEFGPSSEGECESLYGFWASKLGALGVELNHSLMNGVPWSRNDVELFVSLGEALWSFFFVLSLSPVSYLQFVLWSWSW